MKRNDFNSFEEFDQSNTAGDHDRITVIRENGWIKCDLLTDCHSIKTALRRFFNALADIPQIAAWREDITESTENGYFKMNDLIMGDGSRNPSPCYAWEIKDYGDDCYYIFLNVKA